MYCYNLPRYNSCFVATISPEVRQALDRIIADRPGIGETPLFPSPEDPQKPISRQLADAWLRKGEQLAEVEPHKGSFWHAYRREWASERKQPTLQRQVAGPP